MYIEFYLYASDPMQKYLEVKSLYTIGLKTREVENCGCSIRICTSSTAPSCWCSLCSPFVWSWSNPAHLWLPLPSYYSICLVCKRSASCTYNIKGLTSQHITTPKSLASETKQRALLSFSCRRSWPGMSWSAQNFIRISSSKFHRRSNLLKLLNNTKCFEHLTVRPIFIWFLCHFFGCHTKGVLLLLLGTSCQNGHH